MTRGVAIMRVVIGVIGVLMLLGGILLILSGLPGAIAGAIWLVPSGMVLIIVALIEVSRYRSQAAEQAKATPGPGGGETTPPDSRFQRTEEIFVDPTSGRRMRVFMDPNSGERRYVAET